jgi:hypothetical protein
MTASTIQNATRVGSSFNAAHGHTLLRDLDFYYKGVPDIRTELIPVI